ncbi:hypothetical protein FACS1894218_4200 [Bacilli bacterium]|nr:hypothetical protein FACS1894218_4200 [Bacilli bacterium]
MHELVGNTNQKPEHDLNYNNRRTASVLNNKSTQNYNVPNRIAFGSLVENAKVLRSNFSGANAQCLIARKS